MRQQAFRLRVGSRCGWRCMVTGTAVREVLDAAHQPGKDWRTDNEAEDGVLLRADLHRLLDRRLAMLRDGRFWLDAALRQGGYGEFHERSLGLLPAGRVTAPTEGLDDPASFCLRFHRGSTGRG